MINFFKGKNDQKKSSLEVDSHLDLEVYNYLNAIVVLKPNGDIVSYNQVFSKQFGYTHPSIKDSFFNIVLRNNSLEIKKHFENAALGKTLKFDAVGFPKEGKPINLHITLIPIRKKETNHLYAIIKNNNEIQKNQKELHQFQKWQETFNGIDHICSFYYDAINDSIYFSKQFADIVKIKPEETFTLSFNHFLRYVHHDDRERVKETVETSLHEKVGFSIEYRVIRTDQTILVVREQTGTLLDKKGNLDGLVGFIHNITDHKASERILEKENQIKMLYDNPEVGIWSIDSLEGFIVSKGIECITGYTKEEFYMGIQWDSIVYKEDLQGYLTKQPTLLKGNILQHQYRIVHKNGDIRWIQDYTIPTLDSHGNIVRLDGITSDITEQKMLAEKIEYLANYDSLTGVPNRNLFIEKLDHLICKYTNSHNQFAVIKLDIDGFKYVNDTVGNKVGDELLKQFTNRITENLSNEDLLARLGGDSFLIIIDKIESINSLKVKLEKINKSLNEPFDINGYQLYITASFGISIFPENGTTSLELMRNANLALQYAKKRGKNNYHILSQSNSIQSFKNYSIGRDLKKAVENKEMTLHFQPKVDANSNKIIGAEALIRWDHSEWGLISPNEFLTIAEENGLITEIDRWVLKEVCMRIKNWKTNGVPVVPISINVSAIHFMKPDWPKVVAKIIQDADIHPSDIEFEITEGTILNNSETVKNSFLQLKKLGIKINIDDFGKGYSSLSYLTSYPFDVVKIDKSFIQNMQNSERDLHLTKSIIYMAKGLQLRVIAEGVETVQQLQLLKREQCLEIQGYLFSRPLPINEFEAVLMKKVLLPTEPEEKETQCNREHYRLNFTVPLEADMKLVSIAGQAVKLGVTNVLIEDIGVGGLRFLSTLKLPIRIDVIYEFTTEILGKTVGFKGNIIWNEEVNGEIMAYGIEFMIEEKEQAALSYLIDSFIHLLNNSSTLPPYRKISVDRDQYFK